MIQSERETACQILEKEKVYQKKSKEVLEKTLSFSGLAIPEEIDYRAVKIFQNQHIHQIFTKCPQNSQKIPHMVMLHGFGGTGMTYVRMFRRLKEQFQVHSLDGFGIGHSSRGNFSNEFTYEQTRDYFIDAIDEWRRALNIQEFILVGHSFGGYLATCYTEKYPERVSRLILLSPVGASEKTPEQVQEELRKRNEKSLQGRLFTYFAQKIYNMGFRPSKVMGSWYIGEKLIERIVQKRLKLEDQQKQAWKQYFRELSKMDESSQNGFYILFKWPLLPKHTIEAILSRINFKKRIQFYYGQYDWMDSKGARRLAYEHQNITFKLISQADHQLIFDNPDELCYFIIGQKIKQNEEEQQSMIRLKQHQ